MKLLMAAGTGLVLLASAAQAQQVVDGSGKDIPPDIMAKTFQAVTADFFDPVGSQFRRVGAGSREGFICGFVNGKNRMGGYVGFKPFAFNSKTGTAVIYEDLPKTDPVYELSRLGFSFTECPFE